MNPQTTQLEARCRSTIIMVREKFKREMEELDALAEQHETRERGRTLVMLGMAAMLMFSITANVALGWMLWRAN